MCASLCNYFIVSWVKYRAFFQAVGDKKSSCSKKAAIMKHLDQRGMSEGLVACTDLGSVPACLYREHHWLWPPNKSLLRGRPCIGAKPAMHTVHWVVALVSWTQSKGPGVSPEDHGVQNEYLNFIIFLVLGPHLEELRGYSCSVLRVYS